MIGAGSCPCYVHDDELIPASPSTCLFAVTLISSLPLSLSLFLIRWLQGQLNATLHFRHSVQYFVADAPRMPIPGTPAMVQNSVQSSKAGSTLSSLPHKITTILPSQSAKQLSRRQYMCLPLCFMWIRELTSMGAWSWACGCV